MSTSFYGLLALGLLSHALRAQPTARPDSARVIVLNDVAVSAKIGRLVVASGTMQRNYAHTLMPGGGFAVRFGAPQGGYHELRSVRVHLDRAAGDTQLRIWAVRPTATGAPADEDLLPAPVVLSAQALRQAHKNLTLTWPGQHIIVPEGGFFLVVEGLGSTPDEYVSRFNKPATPKAPFEVELSRRDHPADPPRRLRVQDFPALLGAEPASNGAESWHRDTATRQWRPDHYFKARSIVFLEAVFE